MDCAWLKERIAKTKTLIEAYEEATLALGTTGVQSYTLDTGQSRQTVTRSDLGSMRLQLDNLYNRLATLEARLNGGTVTVGPDW